MKVRNGTFAFLFVYVLAALLFVSCAEKNTEEDRESRLVKAYKMIDAGENDRAIIYLEDMRKTDGSEQVQIALASAYAGRAGIHIAGFVNFAMSFTTPEVSYQSLDHPLVSLALQNSGLEKEQNDRLLNDQTLRPVIQSLILVQEYIWRIGLLPTVYDSRQQQDLDHSIQLLDGLPFNRGVALYRSLLRLVTVKSLLYTQVRGQLIYVDQQKCEVQLQKVHLAVSIFLPPMFKLVQDLRVAFPSKEPNHRQHEKYLLDIQREVAKLPQTFAPNALQRSFVKQLFNNSDFWTCQK